MIQLQFLNKLLDTKDASVFTLNNLNEEFFSDYPEQYTFIKNHIDTYNCVPDKETFGAAFENFSFLKVAEPMSYLVDELYNDRNRRLLAKVFNNIRMLLNENKTEEAVKLYEASADLTSKAKHIVTTDIIKDTSRYDAYLEKCADFNRYYVTTGFAELDSIITGWDRLEDYVTIAARPNVGKSWVLLKCATAAAAQGLSVGIYSGEMSENKVGYRFDTLVSHISNGSITHGNSSVQNEYKKYIDELSDKFSTSVKILTPSNIGDLASVSTLKAFIEQEHLDILFVDQHSLLEDDRNAKNPIERASNISKDLKRLQVLEQIPIITVSQQNRSSTENGVNVAHISQSDRIGQDSTIVIFLEQKDDYLILQLEKSRDSSKGKKLKYAVDFNIGTFCYVPEENNAVNGAGVDQLIEEYESDGGDYFS